MATVAFLSSSSKESSSSPSSSTPSFTDRLTGRLVSLVIDPDGILLSPKQLRAQIKCPLELMQAAAWFFTRQSPGMKRHLEEPPPPLDYMLTQFSPCVQCASCAAAWRPRAVDWPPRLPVCT